ncbi:MAG: tetratricopeptide repeat protein [Candidatus Thorarchaeota archaeon]
MDLKKWLYKINKEPRWIVTWYLTTGILCGLTCLILSRTGYLPWDDLTAFLLGFFVPVVTYTIKELMGLYEYPRRYSTYATSERYLELSLEYMEKERWADALSHLETILKAIPGHQRALFNAAICRERLGDNEGAYADITSYLTKAPTNIEARNLQKRVEDAI